MVSEMPELASQSWSHPHSLSPPPPRMQSHGWQTTTIPNDPADLGSHTKCPLAPRFLWVPRGALNSVGEVCSSWGCLGEKTHWEFRSSCPSLQIAGGYPLVKDRPQAKVLPPCLVVLFGGWISQGESTGTAEGDSVVS